MLQSVSGNLYLYRDLRLAEFSRERLRISIGKQIVSRPSRGVYTVGNGPPAASLRALFERLPTGVVLGYDSAARIYGFGRHGPDDGLVHVIVPAGTVRPRIEGVTCHESVVAVRAPMLVDGVLCAPPARCAVDLARAATRPDGLALLDAALRSTTCTADDLAEEVLHHDGLRGVCRVRELVQIADGRAECPQESHLRLLIIDAGLRTPEPQVWVFDSDGRPIFRIDLAYPEHRIGLEYDGRSHLTLDRLTSDRHRMNWLSARSWRMRYYTARDLYRNPTKIVTEVRSLLS